MVFQSFLVKLAICCAHEKSDSERKTINRNSAQELPLQVLILCSLSLKVTLFIFLFDTLAS